MQRLIFSPLKVSAETTFTSAALFSPAGFADPPFAIQGNYIIARADSLDFEKAQVYVFNVSVYDRGDSPLSDKAQVVITLTDENDNPPQFQPSNVYMASVNEGNYASNSTVVLYVSQCKTTLK